MLRKNEKTKIVGVIFPISRKHFSKLFSSNCNIFAKFTKLNIKTGFKIVFYVTGEKLLVGEAIVRRIEKLNPDVAWSKYKDKLFLDKEEYDMYVRVSPVGKQVRKMSEIMIFKLEKASKYERPVKLSHPATPSGRYLTEKMINEIRMEV